MAVMSRLEMPKRLFTGPLKKGGVADDADAE
jgi:hypothetical protein